MSADVNTGTVLPETENEKNMFAESGNNLNISQKASMDVNDVKDANIAGTEGYVEQVEGFNTRYLNEKWIGRYEATGQYVEHVGGEWKSVDEDEIEFIQQLWFEQEASETQVLNGVKMKWNATKQQWEEINVGTDEDFIAQYQANYGVTYDYSKMDEKKKNDEAEVQKTVTEDKKEKKGKGNQEQQGWVDMDEKVHAVYVSNLPLDITEEQFKNFMSKCGVIQPDARNNKPKIKLYKDDEGNVKGDGRCCYIKKESVELALSILDGSNLNGKEVRVERAKFELKGEFDPSKKRKKLTNAQKKRYMENQNRIFEWKPDKPRNYRPISDCTVIIKNLFTLKMMEENAALMMDLKEEVQESCSKYGTVKKVVVYDSNPEGVVSVTFEMTDESDCAVKMLNGRIVDGRRLTAELWDGKTKYKVEESEEDKKKRLAAWEKFIQEGGDEEGNEEGKKTVDKKSDDEIEGVPDKISKKDPDDA